MELRRQRPASSTAVHSNADNATIAEPNRALAECGVIDQRRIDNGPPTKRARVDVWPTVLPRRSPLYLTERFRPTARNVKQPWPMGRAQKRIQVDD